LGERNFVCGFNEAYNLSDAAAGGGAGESPRGFQVLHAANCVEDGALRPAGVVGVGLGGSTLVEKVADGDVGEGIKRGGGGALEPRGVAELRHREAGGGAAEVVGRGSCSAIGHGLFGGKIRVSAGGIVWGPLRIECLGDCN